MNIKQRHFIKSTEIKTLKADVLKHYGENFTKILFPKKCRIEIILTEAGDTLYAMNNKLMLWKSKEGYLPVLKILLENDLGLKTIVVDMGAIKFVTNGADIMRPGITKIDPEIKKNEIIRVSDKRNNRVLAVGKAMFDAKEMDKKTTGKVVRNLHTINDSVWAFSSQFK